MMDIAIGLICRVSEVIQVAENSIKKENSFSRIFCESYFKPGSFLLC
jgi:hypothetical protein